MEESQNKRYFIEGTHGDSDAEWLEFESDNLKEIEKRYLEVVSIDCATEVVYKVFDIIEDKEIFLTFKD